VVTNEVADQLRVFEAEERRVSHVAVEHGDRLDQFGSLADLQKLRYDRGIETDPIGRPTCPSPPA
jgi:hypothetical protein